MKRGMKKAAAWLALLLVLMISAGCFCAAAADSMYREIDNPALEVYAELGYGGVITYGKAFPVRVRIVNHGGDLEGKIAVNAYVNSRQYDRFELEISVPAGAEKTYVLPVTAAVRQEVFTAEILQDGETVCAVNAKPATVANPNAMLIGVLSTRPRQLAYMDIDRENDTLSRYEYWQTVALTEETFPEDRELLKSFGMIVLDDVNPALLTEGQKAALREWLTDGHILLCGGGTNAPRNTAFLADLTGLRTISVTTSDSVADALEALTGNRKSGSKAQTAVAVIAGADAMAADSKGNGLLYRTEAEAGRIYTMAFDPADTKLSGQRIMHTFWQQVMVQWEGSLYYSLLNGSEYTSATVSASYELPVKASSPLVPALLIAAAVPVLGCVLFFLLKKKDRSRWLWGILPVLALAAAAVIWVLAGSSGMNRPMAVTAVNLIQDGEGNVRRYTGIDIAVPRPGQHAFALEGATLEKKESYDYNYYYDEDDSDEIKEPTILRTVIYTGAQDQVAASTTMTWDVVSLEEQSAADLGGKVEAEIWMEADGLHGTVANGTACALKAGVIMTSFGYARIPALAPGAAADFTLIEKQQDGVSSQNTGTFESGVMYRSAPGFYTLIDAMISEDRKAGDDPATLRQSMMNGAIDQMVSGSNGKFSVYSDSGTSAYVYFAEPEDYRAGTLKMDGEEITTSAQAVLLGTAVKYLTIGRTGVVFHAPGMNPAVQVEIDLSGMPTNTAVNTANRYYYTLSETPTFRFTIADADRIRIDRLTIGMESWYVDQARFYLLNIETGQWTEITPNQPVSNTAKYVDPDGNLYCQLRNAGYDAYADVSAPTITVEGGLKDVED